MRPTSTNERRGDVKASGNQLGSVFGGIIALPPTSMSRLSCAYFVGFVHSCFGLFFPGLVRGLESKVDISQNLEEITLR